MATRSWGEQGGCLPVSSELTDTLILDSGLQNCGRVDPCRAKAPSLR